jgi:hypothetical protein
MTQGRGARKGREEKRKKPRRRTKAKKGRGRKRINREDTKGAKGEASKPLLSL